MLLPVQSSSRLADLTFPTSCGRLLAVVGLGAGVRGLPPNECGCEASLVGDRLGYAEEGPRLRGPSIRWTLWVPGPRGHKVVAPPSRCPLGMKKVV